MRSSAAGSHASQPSASSAQPAVALSKAMLAWVWSSVAVSVKMSTSDCSPSLPSKNIGEAPPKSAPINE